MALHNLGLMCEENPTKEGKRSSFWTRKMKPSFASKNVLSFWKRAVPPKSVEGFVRRFYCQDDRSTRRNGFAEFWNVSDIEDMDVVNVKAIVSFLSSPDNTFSSLATSGKRFLRAMLDSAGSKTAYPEIPTPKDVEPSP